MAWKTDDADIVSEIFSAELCTETDLVCLFKYLFLKFHITESASGFITCRRQCIIIMCGSEFHGEEILLC